MPQLVKVAERQNITPGTAIAVEAGGQKIALFNVDGTFYAIGDTCTHEGGPLSDGDLEAMQVVCPWHGAKYDLRTGKVVGPPAEHDVPSYKVVVEGEDIKIEIP